MFCPNCNRPIGKRNRCYFCTGRKRTGVNVNCQQCGKEFYVQPNQIENGEGKYCSYQCSYQGRTGKPTLAASKAEKGTAAGGYLTVWVGYEHPSNHNGRILEHRHVMEQHLGRYLSSEELVHHKDGDPKNNDLSNLELMTNADHARMHMRGRPPAKLVELNCLECGAAFMAEPCKATPVDPKNQRKYCSLACRHKAWARQMVERRAIVRAQRPPKPPKPKRKTIKQQLAELTEYKRRFGPL